jgi:tetratricopeptide (TPR) repeat protein
LRLSPIASAAKTKQNLGRQDDGGTMAADSRDGMDGRRSPALRLDSWKEIAAYLGRHVTTVRRWEKGEGLPVHRHVHDKLGSVYAFREELDAWWESRRERAESHRRDRQTPGGDTAALEPRWTFQAAPRLVAGGAGALGLCAIVAMTVVLYRGSDVRQPAVAGPLAHAAPAPASSVDPAARQEYLIGRYHLWRDSEDNLQRAITHFERATKIEPSFAAAYASLGHAWWKLGLWGQKLSAAESPARAAVRKALELDPARPDAYVVLADLERLYSHDLVRAEALVNHALALDAEHLDAHYTYGLLLMTLGRSAEAVAHMETAARLDPLAPAIQSDLGRVLYRARRYDEAIAHLDRAVALEPGMGWLVQSRLAQVYAELGQYDKALAALGRAGAGGREHTARWARILALAGRHDEARRLLRDLEGMPGRSDLNELASVYVALGDHDAAFALLFHRLEQGDPGPNFVEVDPGFDRLRTDPRWSDLVRRLKAVRPRAT